MGRIYRIGRCRRHSGRGVVLIQRSQDSDVGRVARRGEAALGCGRSHGAVGLVGVRAVVEPALLDVRLELAEEDVEVGGVHVPQAEGADAEAALVGAAVDLGAPLCDGIGDAIALAGAGELARAVELGYRILQGARLRTSWTEFISCPSCGRTLFDLEETTARVQARTGHLKGLKIAVMGCIVNGPGEMADADFGYVGSGPGSVNLYVGKDLVVRNVPTAEADDRLVTLIREHGMWVEPT